MESLGGGLDWRRRALDRENWCVCVGMVLGADLSKKKLRIKLWCGGRAKSSLARCFSFYRNAHFLYCFYLFIYFLKIKLSIVIVIYTCSRVYVARRVYAHTILYINTRACVG